MKEEIERLKNLSQIATKHNLGYISEVIDSCVANLEASLIKIPSDKQKIKLINSTIDSVYELYVQQRVPYVINFKVKELLTEYKEFLEV